MTAEEILVRLEKQAPIHLGQCSRSIDEVCQRGEFPRRDLLAALGPAGARIDHWKISVQPNERIQFSWTATPVTAPGTLQPRGVLMQSAQPETRTIDPVAVGNQARAFQDSELKAGREISTTDAVAHVMAQRRN